ncbi:hypothetical protein DMN91_000109 [Ooceraea biroi]|uniref:Uncharacterized protein n=1 Tax=Ooceraea biroi TaxID=2015173 RepID=A0A3L8E1P9_OOCBI|nr:hypothetical protein DMN91_000109 [Ooceraea biroi]
MKLGERLTRRWQQYTQSSLVARYSNTARKAQVRPPIATSISVDVERVCQRDCLQCGLDFSRTESGLPRSRRAIERQQIILATATALVVLVQVQRSFLDIERYTPKKLFYILIAQA